MWKTWLKWILYGTTTGLAWGFIYAFVIDLWDMFDTMMGAIGSSDLLYSVVSAAWIVDKFIPLDQLFLALTLIINIEGAMAIFGFIIWVVRVAADLVPTGG